MKNGNYLAVKRALSSKEDYNLDQEVCFVFLISCILSVLKCLEKPYQRSWCSLSFDLSVNYHSLSKMFVSVLSLVLCGRGCHVNVLFVLPPAGF